jgi:hypothetical protein
MPRVLAILLVDSVLCVSVRAGDRPVVFYKVDMRTGRLSGGLTAAQVDEVVRFVKTLRGVDHRVVEVDGTSPPQMEVHTGASLVGHGDLLRIEKRRGRWLVLSKAKWRMVVEESGRKGVSPFMHEDEQ